MRRTTITMAVLLVLTAAGCSENQAGVASAGDGGKATATAKAAEPDPLKYARCMRENGVAWFPDPDDAGRTTIRMPEGQDRTTFEAAQETCREFSPEAAGAGLADPELLDFARRMAKCMRENGVPNFPDPQPNGGMQLDRDKIGGGPGSPAFDKAMKVCEKSVPRPTKLPA